ncbi:MAG: purine-nucleoside phosphorylase [Eubacteriales bacterium]
MESTMTRITLAREYIRSKTDFVPEIVVVLGSGLGDYADSLKLTASFKYEDIPGFPVSTAPGHAGRLLFAERCGKKIAVFQGRFHCYEGYSAAETVIPLRTVLLLGAKTALFTNASGGINRYFNPGDLVVVTDHINFSGMSALTGANLEEFGPRFPDVSGAYSKKLIATLEQVGQKNGVSLLKGVYGYMTGPSYETPAEIRALSRLGADVVGMSTVHEVVAASHAGVQTAVISCVCNLAAGVSGQPITHQEVLDAGAKVANQIIILIDGFLQAV